MAFEHLEGHIWRYMCGSADELPTDELALQGICSASSIIAVWTGRMCARTYEVDQAHELVVCHSMSDKMLSLQLLLHLPSFVMVVVTS
jgi:hypothetical protein